MITRKPLPENATIEANAITSGSSRTQNAHPDAWPEDELENEAERIWGDDAHEKEGKEREDGGVGDIRNIDSTKSSHVPVFLHPGAAASYSGLDEEENVWQEVRHDPNAGGEAASRAEALQPGGGRLETGYPRDYPREDAYRAEVGGRVPTVLTPDSSGVSRTETNPFKKRLASSASGKSSQEELNLNRTTAVLANSPVNAPEPPTTLFSEMTLNEPSNNPWQPALSDKTARHQPSPVPAPPAQDLGLGRSEWNPAELSRQATPGTTSYSPALLSLPSEEEPAGWEEEVRAESSSVMHFPAPTDGDELEDAHAWDDIAALDKGKAPAARPIPIPGARPRPPGPNDDWNLIDMESPPGPPPGHQTPFPSDQKIHHEDGEAPPLPPRTQADGASSQSQSQPSRPVAETYQIKKINWFDARGKRNPRTSPILVQNANGPCPLVALVNALILTTPVEMGNTSLVGVLQSREQVSISLLLQSLFDELITRRGDADTDLPDVAELLAFLQGLQTGMNVNPRFIPAPELVAAFKRTSLTHLHPSERGDLIPGTFEDTRDMALYSTFSVPLIHGWLPSKTDPAHDAFARHAVSYEKAQDLLVREDELEEKLSNPSSQGLTEEEQQIYQDILMIKSFLSVSSTQLTPWGLQVITKAMKPGSVAILFRNDHFSTLYRHPQTLGIMTLVTDAGYAGHAEVVWESLVDVNGERAEFFSGDFRVVGGASHGPHSAGDSRMPGSFPGASYHQDGGSGSSEWPSGDNATSSNNNGWTTVQGKRARKQAQTQPDYSDEAPLSPKHEQEDRDLALALQLQEEEEERHRAEQARRRRESQLSEQFIEQQARTPSNGGSSNVAATANATRGGHQNRGGGPPITPARRSSSAVNNVPVTVTGTSGNAARGGSSRPAARQTVRSLLPPVNTGVNRPRGGAGAGSEDADDAPPSYEHAAKQTPYVPPEGHPSHPASSPDNTGAGGAAGAAGRRAPSSSSASLLSSASAVPRSSQQQQQQQQSSAQLANRAGRRISNTGAVAASGDGGRDRECVVM